MNIILKARNFVVITCMMLFSTFVAANDTPHALVKKTATDLISALTADPEKLKKNPELYEKIVTDVLVPVVDFETLTKGVMGRQYYQQASDLQRQNFIKVFHNSLVSTYSTGLSIFDSQEIKVLAPDPGSEDKPVQAVNMEVKTAEGTIFPLRFSMKKDDAGEWKMINVILNGVNVGKAYNTHFEETMKKYGGDMDQLIANWNAKISTEKTP